MLKFEKKVRRRKVKAQRGLLSHYGDEKHTPADTRMKQNLKFYDTNTVACVKKDTSHSLWRVEF